MPKPLWGKIAFVTGMFFCALSLMGHMLDAWLPEGKPTPCVCEEAK